MLDTITWNSYLPTRPLPSLDQSATRRWLIDVVHSHGLLFGEVNYIFCTDEEILDVNRCFLGHDYYTDIITFDYDKGRLVSGDIYISLDTVESNAELFGQHTAREFHRVLAHGVLHLCGINDKGPGEREIMEANEDRALNMLPAQTLSGSIVFYPDK